MAIFTYIILHSKAWVDNQGSEKWIAQIAALLEKMPSVRQIGFRKYGRIPQITYTLDNVQQCFVQVSDD